jgi:ubiquinone/menaquinone biosynthesis C-methylase UbiE
MNSVQTTASLSQSELRALLLQYRRENWEGIQTAPWQERIVEDILSDDGETVLRQLAAFGPVPAGACLLDVGSGVGSFVVASRRRGLRAFGIEPDQIGQGGRLTAIQIASRRLPNAVFAVAEGERLPFPDQTFDFVTLNQVIEHVSDQRAVLREAARVLKRGGTLYVACPNYLRFYEPHYKIFWLPLLPKPLGRFYLRCRGRNSVLLDQLTYTTNSRLRRLLQELGEEYALIDTHQHQFLKKCADGSFASPRARMIGKLTHLPVFGSLIRRAALLFLRVTQGGCEMLVRCNSSAAGGSC